ncbi:MAG: hypothetical protein Q9194_004354 [Teloschistes cf. exilis]
MDQLEQKDSFIRSRKYHLTINDIKAEALARGLLVLFLLTELDGIDESKETERTEALTTLFFLYIAPVVPQRFLVEALRSWRGKLRSKYSVVEALQMHIDHLKSHFADYLEDAERSVEPNKWHPERTLFVQTGAYRPPESWAREYEPILSCARSNKKHTKKIKTHVSNTWTMNVTMLDARWQGPLYDTFGAVLSFDPFGAVDNLYLHTGLERPQQKPCLYNHVARFFAHVATAIGRLRKRLVIEIMDGEVNNMLETIRYNSSDRPETFPVKYDRVHLSNIPDYIGGILTSILFAMPILKDTLSSTMVSCCLSNTPAWKNMVAYYIEYLLVNDETTIRKLFQVEEFSDDSDDAAIHALRTRLCSVPVHIRKELHLEDLKPFGIDENIVGMSTAPLRKLDLRSISIEHLCS